jgi:hypothetical protein
MFSLTFDTNEQAKVRTRDVNGDLADWELARRYFARFRRRVKRYCDKHGLTYDLVAVAELQKRGVQHFHVATALPLRHADLLAMWGYGTVWISGGRAARRRDKRRPGSEASYVASYISKYMGKDMVQEPEEGPEQERGQAGGGAVSGRGFHKSRYHRARSLKLPFEEHLLEPGDMSAFQGVLEQDGFQMSCEPFLIEKEGVTYGWWARSVQMSMESGHLTHAPAPAGGGEDAGGGRPSHSKDGQVVTKPQTQSPHSPPEGAKHSQKSTGSERRNSRTEHQRKQVARVGASREPWGGGEEDA